MGEPGDPIWRARASRKECGGIPSARRFVAEGKNIVPLKSVTILTNDPAPEAHPLARALRGMPALNVRVTAAPDAIAALPKKGILVALIDSARPFAPLTAAHEAALIAHVQRGGGLVLAGGTLDAWREYPALRTALGLASGMITPYCDIIAETTGAIP